MPSFSFHPLTPDRWPDLEALFGPRGACAGCWCMYWRQSRKDFEQMKGEPNRLAFKALVTSGDVPGILAYDGERPAGWVSLAPREAFPTLKRSRILKPIDEQPVWSVVCFLVHKDYRRRGLTVELLRAAEKFAASQGARILEGYPEEPKSAHAPAVFIYTGVASAFLQAGYEEAARRSPARPVMRKSLRE